MSKCAQSVLLLLLVLVGCQGPNPILQLQPLDGHALAAAFSSDGRWVAAGEASGTVRVWDLHSGSLRAQHDGFRAPGTLAARSMAFSPDGTRLAYASAAGARLGDWQTDQAFALDGHAMPIHDLAFTRDEKLVAVSGGHHHTPRAVTATREPLVVTTWDARSGKLLTRAADDTSGAMNAAVAPDGKRFAMNCVEGSPRRFDQLTPTTPLRARLVLCETATARTLAAADLKPGAGALRSRPTGDGCSPRRSTAAMAASSGTRRQLDP